MTRVKYFGREAYLTTTSLMWKIIITTGCNHNSSSLLVIEFTSLSLAINQRPGDQLHLVHIVDSKFHFQTLDNEYPQ